MTARRRLTVALMALTLGGCISPVDYGDIRHADYIGSWLQVLREDNRAIVRAASQASKAADWLLAHAPEGAAHVVTADELERRVA